MYFLCILTIVKRHSEFSERGKCPPSFSFSDHRYFQQLASNAVYCILDMATRPRSPFWVSITWKAWGNRCAGRPGELACSRLWFDLDADHCVCMAMEDCGSKMGILEEVLLGG